jgi:hypothetical protein
MINWHELILDGKAVADDALPELELIKVLIPPCLHHKADKIIDDFKLILSTCTKE